MFEDQNGQNFSIGFDPNKKKPEIPAPTVEVRKESGNWKVFLVVSILLLFVGLLVGSIYFILKYPKQKSKNLNQPANVIDNVATSTLPGNILSELPSVPVGNATGTGEMKSEDVSFGSFYKYDAETLAYNGSTVEMPLEVKKDVTNYYDVARKINLDKSIKSLNRSGFALVDNSIPEAKDFYSAYAALMQKGVPQLITSDFLIYYQQNKFKEIYDDIKANAFYIDLWNINKHFFEIANNRYKQKKLELGDSNSPVLEAQRLEAAFFAVTLELLKPQKDQVNSGKISNPNLFSAKEANEFSFDLPVYLNEDVSKEVAMIRFANRKAKSPLLLYTKDYVSFQFAKKDDARLNNYESASRWFNSLYPLFSADDSCPDCLLDKNDWLINFITAQYIAKDFMENQELKNDWAKIYKINSFFSGLRQELTYLHYAKAAQAIHGDQYSIEKIFDESLPFENKLKIAEEMRDRIMQDYAFPILEGGLDRSDEANKPMLGMKMLQDNYWPDDYIMRNLIDPKVTKYTGASNLKNSKEKSSNTTSCQGKTGAYVRCRPFGLDVVHLVAPVNSDYYTENTSYENYDVQIGGILSQLQSFNNDSWHSNIYWSTLSLIDQAVYKQSAVPGPINTSNEDWGNWAANTSLGAWVNLRLPTEKIVSTWQSKESNFTNNATQSFIEPNWNLINGLIANAKMMEQMLYALKVVKDVDNSAKRIGEYIDEMDKLKVIVKKELEGEKVTDNDQIFISELLRKKIGKNPSKKTVYIKYGKDSISESIEGIRWVAAVYQNGDKKNLVVGPVFNYQEAGKVRIYNNQ